MEKFDAIVVGGGSGLSISSSLASQGKSVAVVEKGPLGGTCLNRGCIPSKIVIHSADVMETILNAGKFGIMVKGKPTVDFASITRRASSLVDADARRIEQGIRKDPNTTLFKAEARFMGKKTMLVSGKKITADKIFIMAGTRPAIPPVEGLEGSGYMTSTEALRLEKQPRSMVVLGGGYIAAELAHFYGALGTKITIIQRSTLLKNEDREVAELFTKEFSRKHKVLLGYEAERVQRKGGKFIVTAASKSGRKRVEADQLLVATGRIPNTDILDVQKAGIRTDKRGYIETNEFLETSAPGVWAAGDIAGKFLFKHSANLEAEYALRNAYGPEKRPVNYLAMPHAVFSSPQVAGVGMTEQELEARQAAYMVGKHYYKQTGMGEALQEEKGFVKLLVDPETRKILGCHIIGPEASTLIHEVLVAMRHNLPVDAISGTVHIHPALSEVVQRATWSLE